jgi:DNA-directed RNA polymerase subunit M/transcription elongation factor TFIIS
VQNYQDELLRLVSFMKKHGVHVLRELARQGFVTIHEETPLVHCDSTTFVTNILGMYQKYSHVPRFLTIVEELVSNGWNVETLLLLGMFFATDDDYMNGSEIQDQTKLDLVRLEEKDAMLSSLTENSIGEKTSTTYAIKYASRDADGNVVRATPGSVPTAMRCPKCKSTLVYCLQVQTRGADEAATNFMECHDPNTNCHHRWKL